MPLPRHSAGGGRPAGRSLRAWSISIERSIYTTVLAALSAVAILPATASAGRLGNERSGGVIAPDALRSLAAFEHSLGLFDPGRGAELRMARRLAAEHRAHAARDATMGEIHRMIAAGDRIAHLPYVYGGGHGSFDAPGYDCSGSVSYVLHGAGLLGTPMDSSELESYGDPGPGRHVTIYANPGHALMTIDGRRFDTIAFQETGTRWADSVGDVSGYVVRHPPGM